MPAMLDDPDAATIYRVSGQQPYPDPAHPSLPPSITPRHVTLRDRQTVATVVPFASRYQVPDSLLRYLNDQFNKEIEGGDTYPMMDGLPFDKFASYWFQNFGAIMLLGNIESAAEVVEGKDWSKECLGTFYIKPNYPGRSSHVCNAGFIVTDAARNRGVGRLMGESYLDWAPKLGYTYSVFNLVYETNVASCKIWDALGFKRIGRVKEAGNLKSYPGQLIDAIIYGRDLGGDVGSDDPVSEERFDKIKYYLKYGRYPSGADRAEKSRLRSAATHYKLIDNVLMLKDKEVIAHPKRQYDIARLYHNNAHAGINKTTATIAERYHWSRIKETVSDVIRNCPECKELGKTTGPAQSTPAPSSGNAAAVNHQARAAGRPSNSGSLAPSVLSSKRKSHSPSASGPGSMVNPRAGGWSTIVLPEPVSLPDFATIASHHYPDANTGAVAPAHTLQSSVDTMAAEQRHVDGSTNNPMLQDQPHDVLRQQQHTPTSTLGATIAGPPHHHPSVSVYHPIDPQIINQPSAAAAHIHAPHHGHHHALHHDDDATALHAYSPFPQHHHHAADAHTFEALLLNDAELSHDPDPPHPHHDAQHEHHRDPDADHHHRLHLHHDGMQGLQQHHRSREEEEAAVDRDLEMLIQQPQEDEEEEIEGRGEDGRGRGMDVDVDVDGDLDGDGAGGGEGGAETLADGMEDVVGAGRGEGGAAEVGLVQHGRRDGDG